MWWPFRTREPTGPRSPVAQRMAEECQARMRKYRVLHGMRKLTTDEAAWFLTYAQWAAALLAGTPLGLNPGAEERVLDQMEKEALDAEEQ